MRTERLGHADVRRVTPRRQHREADRRCVALRQIERIEGTNVPVFEAGHGADLLEDGGPADDRGAALTLEQVERAGGLEGSCATTVAPLSGHR
jgi:hypothetical protein